MSTLNRLGKQCIKRGINWCRQKQKCSSLSSSAKLRVLGIESSCDDTGVGIVTGSGEILANALHSQTTKSVECGGVIIPYAQMIHESCIERLVHEAVTQAEVTIQDLDAVAVSVEPGLVPCLMVGLNMARQLALEHRVPFIPIHHMEAHALTARMIHRIEFPFLVFLLSGGHCLLAVARDVDDFLLLGSTLDIAPGDCYDKLARTLKLRTLPECQGLSGGAMVELVARGGNPAAVPGVSVMLRDKSCNFSLNGMLEAYRRTIAKEEEKQGIKASEVLTNAADVCASFQLSVLMHLTRPLQRAFMYTEMKGLLQTQKTLVVSGGVACNAYLREGMERVCNAYSCDLISPPPHLCTDNGIMVAWNGIEKLKVGRGIAADPASLDVRGKSPLGVNISKDVIDMNIKVPTLDLFKNQNLQTQA